MRHSTNEAAEVNEVEFPYGGGCRGGLADEPPAQGWTEAEIADANAEQAEWEAELDMRDDYVRQVIEPLTRCPGVASVHVRHTNAATYAATAATYSREAPHWTILVTLRRGISPLKGGGSTLGEAVAEVLVQVKVIVAAAEGAVARA